MNLIQYNLYYKRYTNISTFKDNFSFKITQQKKLAIIYFLLKFQKILQNLHLKKIWYLFKLGYKNWRFIVNQHKNRS